MTIEPYSLAEIDDAIGERKPQRKAATVAALPVAEQPSPIINIADRSALPKPIPYRTPLEVASATKEQPDWLVRGYAALGAITEVDGKVKSSGKTTLLTHVVAAILDGHQFLGQPTMKTNVVYYTEQTEATYREALARAGLLGRGAEMRLVFRGDVADRSWSEIIAGITEDMKRDGYGLLVVDTLGKLASIREENDAGEGARAMTPLQDAAHNGLAVIICRHDRKSGGDVGESGRGSSAISGDVDVILQLRRPEGNQPSSRRVIETLSRYSETPEKVVIELTEEGYVLLGDEEAVTLNDAIRKVSAHLHEVFEQNESATLDELVSELDMTRAAIQRALKELRHRGEVQDFTDDGGKPRKGHPLRYSLKEETDSAHTNGLYGQKEFGVAE